MTTAFCYIQPYFLKPRKAPEQYLTVHIRSDLKKGCKDNLAGRLVVLSRYAQLVKRRYSSQSQMYLGNSFTC